MQILDIGLFFFLCGLFSFVMKGDHLLMMLLSLEYMMVSIFLCLFGYMSLMVGHFYLLMFFLVVVICESSVGLSLLVGAVRFYKDDMVYMHI